MPSISGGLFQGLQTVSPASPACSQDCVSALLQLAAQNHEGGLSCSLADKRQGLEGGDEGQELVKKASNSQSFFNGE